MFSPLTSFDQNETEFDRQFQTQVKRQVPMQKGYRTFQYKHKDDALVNPGEPSKFKDQIIHHKIFREAKRSQKTNLADASVEPVILAHFSKILIDYVFLERTLEKQKVQLLNCPDFNLVDSFKIFDEKSRGAVNQIEFQSILKEFYGIEAKNHQIYAIYRKFSNNNDQLIRFEDYCYIMMPQN